MKKDEDYLERVRQTMSCVVCGIRPVDPHHVTTRAAGGTDEPYNILPVCRLHHREYHAYGPGKMVSKYLQIKQWLIDNKRDDVFERIKRK